MARATERNETYDRFLGHFVDRVQTDGTDFQILRSQWLDRCPGPWRDRFLEDLIEIDSLLELGVLGREGVA